MPLHELYGMVKEKLDSKEMNTKTCAVDQSSLPENDFSELVWENGHISMLGQSNIPRKIPTFQLHKGHHDKDVGYVNSNTNNNATNLRMLRFESDLDNGLNENRLQDEDVLPWLNYGIDDYNSDFLPELPELLDKRSNSNQLFRESHTTSSRVSNITENTTSNVGETIQTPSGSSGFSSLRMDKQDPIVSSNSCTIMNFSHFARPAAIVKANLRNIDIGDMNKGNVASRSYHGESTRVVFNGECPKEAAIHVMEPSKVDLKPLQPKSLEQNAAVTKQCDHACNVDVSKIDRASDLVLGESHGKEQEAVEKRIEPAVASSSVCSGNGSERFSDDPNQSLKRKSRDTKDSECQSEDADEESVGVKKAAPARGVIGSKRSRSAEVHNLSERVDKASMLDEAIEYLKTLQLQVQIMSMGAGLYMPAMMLPMGMQHMQASHIAPFSPMAMQMGYGMRIHDNNGGSSRFPMAHVPQIQGTNLLSAHMSGATDSHGMAARSYPQVFGVSNQGLSVPMPCSPLLPFQGEPLMNQSSLGLMETVDSVSTSSLKNPMPNVNSQVMQNTNACNSAIQMPNQCGARNVGFEHSANLVHNSGHAFEANDIRVVIR
ncbi:hypothetical protein TanjilG_07479 [Lupinus angustifolius]|uniref:BHLH domain-containing protein n=1 Tax=Lupinus angustifolius TaxID=3871 RepID=A0A4P1QUT7_LUPAN|nr:hypothetical protein TanjilG_07479 [Lupinus angustifolius]